MASMMANLQASVGDQLRHGAESAQAYAERTIARLDAILEALDRLDATAEMIDRATSQDADAAGLAEIVLPGPRAGFQWIVTRASCVVPAGAASIGVIYVGSTANTQARHVIPDADLFAEGIIDLFVPSGSPVIFRITGAPAGAKIAVAIQAKELRTE